MAKPPVKALVKSTYRALADGWIAGRRVQAGERLELTAEEARYEAVAPEQGNPVAEKSPAKRRAEAPTS